MSDDFLTRKVERLLPLFYQEKNQFLYERKLCVPGKTFSAVMQHAHDTKKARRFEYFKTQSMLKNYH